MEQHRAPRRPVDGIVLLDKPAGQTSNRALQTVKRIYRAAKAGHTGSLDPFATGMLPICLGAATKISAFLLDASKEYAVEVALGTATDTADLDGRIIGEAEVPSSTAARLDEVLQSFRGPGTQVPPMYSALKHEGRRLYALARQGIEVERRPRAIRIEWIRLESLDLPRFGFSVRCSKGTYVRALATDIADRLGTLGHVTALRRLAVDPFAADGMVTVETLEAAACRGLDALDALLLPADSALTALPRIDVSESDTLALAQGRTVAVDVPAEAYVRVYGPGGRFIGLGERDEHGALRPRRIFL